MYNEIAAQPLQINTIEIELHDSAELFESMKDAGSQKMSNIPEICILQWKVIYNAFKSKGKTKESGILHEKITLGYNLA